MPDMGGAANGTPGDLRRPKALVPGGPPTPAVGRGGRARNCHCHGLGAFTLLHTHQAGRLGGDLCPPGNPLDAVWTVARIAQTARNAATAEPYRHKSEPCTVCAPPIIMNHSWAML